MPSRQSTTNVEASQPLRNTVIHVHCKIVPGLLVDVCRELRSGYRAVVSELQSTRNEVRSVHTRLSDMAEIHEETKTQLLASFRAEMTALAVRIENGSGTSVEEGPTICSKNGCTSVVTKRFRSGKPHRQCTTCLDSAHISKVKTLNK